MSRLIVVLGLVSCVSLATTIVSHQLATVLATCNAVALLTALYFLYQQDQRKLRWIHGLYWARNKRLGRFFRDEYDGEVESEFNGRPVKFRLAQPLNVILAGRGRGLSDVALSCRAGFEFSITPRGYDYGVAQPTDLQGRDGAETGDLEIDAEFVCRTAAREAFVGWLREPEVRACVVDLFRAGTAHQLSFTTGFLKVIYRDKDMVKATVDAALSVLERLAISLERGVMPASGAG